jgi:hypothetical protein
MYKYVQTNKQQRRASIGLKTSSGATQKYQDLKFIVTRSRMSHPSQEDYWF